MKRCLFEDADPKSPCSTTTVQLAFGFETQVDRFVVGDDCAHEINFIICVIVSSNMSTESTI